MQCETELLRYESAKMHWSCEKRRGQETEHDRAERVSRAVCVKRLARSASEGLAERVPPGRDDNKQ